MTKKTNSQHDKFQITEGFINSGELRSGRAWEKCLISAFLHRLRLFTARASAQQLQDLSVNQRRMRSMFDTPMRLPNTAGLFDPILSLTLAQRLEVVSAKAIKTLEKLEAFNKNALSHDQTRRKVFESSTSELLRNAEAKNLDRATLAFAQMTMSSVKCH